MGLQRDGAEERSEVRWRGKKEDWSEKKREREKWKRRWSRVDMERQKGRHPGEDREKGLKRWEERRSVERRG